MSRRNTRRTKIENDSLPGGESARTHPRLWLAVALGSLVLEVLVLLATPSRVRAFSEPGLVDGSFGVATASRSPARRLIWRRSDGFGRRGEAGYSALAADAQGEWLAVGGEAGLLVGRPADGARPRSLAIGGVRDLCFGARGELYVATDRGLWVLPAFPTRFARVLQEFSPATGEEARRVNRIAIGSGFVAVATDDGAFVSSSFVSSPRGAQRSGDGSREGLQWIRLDADFPAGPVTAVAGGGEDEQGATRLWAVVGSALWSALLPAAGGVEDVREVVVPGRAHGEVPVDLVAGLPGGVIALVYADSLLFRVREAYTGRQAWKVVRPALPPGASITRLGYWRGGFWLATDRGLMLSDFLVGPWRRAGPPAGRAATRAAVALGTRLYVAGTRGLLFGEPVGRPQTEFVRVDTSGELQTLRRRAPSIGAVHRAVLRHQGLEVRVFDNAWHGVRRRGWLPTVGLRLGVDRDTGRGSDDDEIFVSGDYHLLRDSDRDRSLGLGASLTMTWDLRDLAYEPELIGLSREARLVIGLRDDVLDEVNQLYFERRAVESDLAALSAEVAEAPDPAAEVLADPAAASVRMTVLELRLEELTAGLDAWTGGWFSKQLARSTPLGV